MSFASKFDRVIINDDLTTAENEALNIIQDFLGK